MWCSWGHYNQLPLKALGEDVTLTPLCEKKNPQHFLGMRSRTKNLGAAI